MIKLPIWIDQVVNMVADGASTVSSRSQFLELGIPKAIGLLAEAQLWMENVQWGTVFRPSPDLLPEMPRFLMFYEATKKVQEEVHPQIWGQHGPAVFEWGATPSEHVLVGLESISQLFWCATEVAGFGRGQINF